MSAFWIGYIAGAATPVATSVLLILLLCIPEIREARARKKETKKYLADALEWQRRYRNGDFS